MRKWALDGPISNPPAAHGFPTAPSYLQQYAIHMAYVTQQQPREARMAYKRRIYDNCTTCPITLPNHVAYGLSRNAQKLNVEERGKISTLVPCQFP